MTAAITIFAKTPDLSPCKTRLVEGIGAHAAAEFYHLSLNAMHSLMEDLQARGHTCCWVLAEPEGVKHAFWAGQQVRYAGDGTLGDRLHFTYSSLLETHDKVVLMGADAPQLTADFVESALKELDHHSYTASPATDGGFTLFAGKEPISHHVWARTPYSASNTLQVLLSHLRNYTLLDSFSDVDTYADLAQLYEQMPPAPNAAQEKIRQWLEKYLSM